MAFIGDKPLCDFNTAPTAEQIGLNVMLWFWSNFIPQPFLSFMVTCALYIAIGVVDIVKGTLGHF